MFRSFAKAGKNTGAQQLAVKMDEILSGGVLVLAGHVRKRPEGNDDPSPKACRPRVESSRHQPNNILPDRWTGVLCTFPVELHGKHKESLLIKSEVCSVRSQKSSQDSIVSLLAGVPAIHITISYDIPIHAHLPLLPSVLPLHLLPGYLL